MTDNLAGRVWEHGGKPTGDDQIEPDLSWFDPAKMADTGAIISECRRYRYALWRFWRDGGPFVNFVMLNPSTADAYTDDATIRRCVAFAKGWEGGTYGGVVVTNLYAFRSRNPDALKSPWPQGVEGGYMGPLNDGFIRKIAGAAGLVVCGWGGNVDKIPAGAGRANFVRNSLLPKPPVTCVLTTTGTGQPGHPLYLKKSLEPRAWDDA